MSPPLPPPQRRRGPPLASRRAPSPHPNKKGAKDGGVWGVAVGRPPPPPTRQKLLEAGKHSPARSSAHARTSPHTDFMATWAAVAKETGPRRSRARRSPPHRRRAR